MLCRSCSSRNSRIKLLRSHCFSLRCSKVSALDHFVTIYVIPIYFVELELHVRSKCCANLLLCLVELIVFP
jgi:hypothetical protein